jgi:hypothetical protein
MQRRRARMLTITGERLPQVRQSGISAVLVDQSR